MTSPQEWYNSLGPITRWWLTLAVGSSVAARFGVPLPLYMAFLWDRVWDHFEVWRIALNFCYFGKLSFNFFIQMMML